MSDITVHIPVIPKVHNDYTQYLFNDTELEQIRRRFDEYLATVPKNVQKQSEAYMVMKQIQAIYREEGKFKEFTSPERLSNAS